MDVKKAYNHWSEHYDNQDNKTRDMDLRMTRAHFELRHLGKVLELGCGTGKNTSWLSKQADELWAVDFSSDMLAFAKTKASAEHVKFVEMNLLDNWDLPFGYFDLVMVNLVLEHIQDLNMFFSKTYDVLVEGGTLYVSELHPFKQYLGSKAGLDTEEGRMEPDVYLHNLSDYFTAASNNALILDQLTEGFDDGSTQKVPRLLCMEFYKK